MKLGEKIRKLRNMAGLTQNELGQMIGFPTRTADSRMRKYESCQMAPKEDIRTKLAEALDVDMSALSDIDVDTYEDVMHILFLLEDKYGMQIEREENKTSLVFDNNSGTATILNSYLYTWNAQKKKRDQAIDEVKASAEEQYDRWKARFPKDIKAYWNEQIEKLDKAYEPYMEASHSQLDTVSDFITQIRKLSQHGITIDAQTKLNSPGDGCLILTFLLTELLDPKEEVCKAFGDFLKQLAQMQDYGINIERSLFTTERGNQVSYMLHKSQLMALKSVVWDIQNFERKNDNNDWDKEMFEMGYEDTLRQFRVGFNG